MRFCNARFLIAIALVASATVAAECPRSAAEAAKLTPATAAMACLREGFQYWKGRDAVQAAEMQLALGKLLEETGDFGAARAELDAAARTFEASQRHLQFAEAHRMLGWVHYKLGDYASAEPALRRALALMIQHDGPRAFNTAKASNSLGVLLRDRGEYEAAQRALEDALAIAQEHSGRDPEDLVAVIHNNLAGLWYYRSDFRRAIEEFDRARRMFIALYGERHTTVAMTYNNLGNMYQELGAYEDAERWLQRALPLKIELFGPEHATVASTVANLGLVAESRGNVAQARTQYERARAIYIAALGERHPNVANVETMWGALELRAGNPAQAREHLERAVEIREQGIGPNSSWVAEALNDLGQAYQALDRPADARAALQRSITVAIPSGETELLWEAYAAYARVLNKQGLLEPAVFFGKQAVNLIQDMRAGLAALDQPLQRSFLAHREPAYRELADVLITLGRIPEAQQVLDMLKEEEYLDYVRTRAADEDFGSTRAGLTGRERAFADRLNALSAQLKQAKSEEQREQARAALASLLSEIVQSGTRRAAGSGQRSLQSDTADLPPGTTALRFVVMPDRIRILGTSGERQWQRDSQISSAALNRRVFELRQLIQNPRSQPRDAAMQLYDILIGPVAVDLENVGTRRLLLIQDGTLRYLPFGVLHDAEQYLVEKYELLIATPAGRSSDRNGTDVPERVAAFGVTKGIEGLSDLPRVAIEVDRIVRRDEQDRDGILPGIIALDEAFTATRFGDALAAGFPSVHIASHFVFRPGPVDESFLLLGGGSKLTLDQLRSTRYSLRNVQLLTLSACETAIGQPDANGREFESFGVLAQRQGARAVLATLWPVTDLSTATFMARFYRERQTTQEPAAALRRTQLAFLQRAGSAPVAPIYRHPFYWAPYVIMAPVPEKSSQRFFD